MRKDNHIFLCDVTGAECIKPDAEWEYCFR